MHPSFIFFIVLAIVVVAVAAYRLGVAVSKASKKESPEARNTVPYDKCLEKNAVAFGYGSFTDARDGETYRTVKIGKQEWMAENLRFKAEGSYAPDNEEANVKPFGRLYTWTVAMRIEESYSAELYRDEDTTTVKGICPSGSRLPSKAEWDTLLESGVLFIESSALSGNFWGLGITPSGYQISGSFTGKGTHAAFWTASETAAATSYGAFYNGYTRQPQTTSKTAALSSFMPSAAKLL